MPDSPKDLKRLSEQDPFGLLTPRPLKANSVEHASLIASFEEITAFVEREGRPPCESSSDVLEYQLFKRLETIRSSPEKVKTLKPYDFKLVLQGHPEANLVDVIKDDVHGLLQVNDDGDTITNLKFVKKSERINPVYLSRRTKCPDFSKYVDSFNKVHMDLTLRKRRPVVFSSSSLSEGNFYILSGLLFYLESINADLSTIDYKSGSRDRYDGRTRCVFENGTQSDMLFRSLVKAMEIDGYSISEVEGIAVLPSELLPEDKVGGYIYVLKTLHEDLKSMEDLYKIGHTTTTVAERTKNAKDHSTYLFSDVELVATFKVANVPSASVERALHTFFDLARLDVEIKTPNQVDATFRPKEWFNVKFSVIEEAIILILQGKDSLYMYDGRIRAIIKRPN